jgi:hypothetical protein
VRTLPSRMMTSQRRESDITYSGGLFPETNLDRVLQMPIRHLSEQFTASAQVAKMRVVVYLTSR